ncbi:MAG: hypothetical protein QF824_05775 [Candidatus Woesearchaeota archaeon]|jgi:hypothetical protein|nr:hypothetical protein [Candidatus Woesearchaeota archaeon]
MANTKQFADEMVRDFGAIDDWTPDQTYKVAKMIVTGPLGKEIASGNKRFLDQAVGYHEDNFNAIATGKKSFQKYSNGIKNHIKRALPHQWGHIAAGGDGPVAGGVRGYDTIMRELHGIDNLSVNGIIQLTREVTTDPELSSVRGQAPNMKTLGMILGAYDSRVDKDGVPTAQEYLHSASSSGKIRLDSLKNILKKSYLPNLEGHLSKRANR